MASTKSPSVPVYRPYLTLTEIEALVATDSRSLAFQSATLKLRKILLGAKAGLATPARQASTQAQSAIAARAITFASKSEAQSIVNALSLKSLTSSLTDDESATLQAAYKYIESLPPDASDF